MPDLKSLHDRLKASKRERREIQKVFKDDLAHNARYQQIVEQQKSLKEEKKSIENQAWSQSSGDAEKVDRLTLDIKADKEMLADVAINMVSDHKPIEIIDETNQRWTPQFSVAMKKDDAGVSDEQKR